VIYGILYSAFAASSIGGGILTKLLVNKVLQLCWALSSIFVLAIAVWTIFWVFAKAPSFCLYSALSSGFILHY